VFSSSSDLIVEKQPGSDHSSSDENQNGEGDSKDEEEANEAQQVGYTTTSYHIFTPCPHPSQCLMSLAS
jgi:hypothetical protein